ncbi:MAG: hypothetical protein LBK65_00205 [Tannerellaceae bacterium]|jgi:hypothetical protein|nr:hypothetical protein [Tannerellaceae bacterium]
MHIANPIYDVVFKFMIEDNRVAKAFLSAIIGEEVLELDFASQERIIRVPSGKGEEIEKAPEGSGKNFTVCRFDFSARIATTGGGYKTVLIELQKAKLASDIMRFRRYVGLHYQNPDNSYGEGDSRKARQIYCIFLLGYDIGFPGSVVVSVDSMIRDVTTGKALSGPNEFTDSLHHRSWIVQTEQLKYHRRTDLEKLLSIFDQENRTRNHHILNVDEDEFPEKYRPIIRRLRMASESEDMQIEMEMEDDYLKELQDKERAIEEKDKTIEEQGETIIEQGKALVEQGKALKEKDEALAGQVKALEEKDRAIEELRKQLAALRK